MKTSTVLMLDGEHLNAQLFNIKCSLDGAAPAG